MKELNSELLSLYKSNWDKLSNELIEIKNSNSDTNPTNPLLIRIGDEKKYQEADLRVMIFGQETNDWGNDFQNDIEYIQSIYDGFFTTKHCFSYAGQFWNGISRFLKKLDEKNKEKPIEFIWNNVVKIGKSGGKGMPPEYIYQIEKNHFSILSKEIEILKPNIVLFLSGPYRDYILRNQFENIEFESIENYGLKQLAKVKLENVEYAFRTYHPNYLWRVGINNYFDTIIDEIK